MEWMKTLKRGESYGKRWEGGVFGKILSRGEVKFFKIAFFDLFLSLFDEKSSKNENFTNFSIFVRGEKGVKKHIFL
jgi:hypothetical protein